MFSMLPEFPSIPCIYRALDRNDTVVQVQNRLGTACYIQEKVDGANIGFGLINNEICLRNRNYVLNKTFKGKTPETQQFQSTWQWIHEHKRNLKELNALTHGEIVIYAEWMLLTHSLFYDKLPSLVLPYKLYNLSTHSWISPIEAQQLLMQVHLPIIKSKSTVFSQETLTAELAAPSEFRTGIKEGVVITFEDGVVVKFHHPQFKRNGDKLRFENLNLITPTDAS